MTPTLVAKRQRGFTLLELMVVLAIMLLAAGLIVPNLGNTSTSTFNAEVRQAVAILKYARRVAIVDSMPQTAHFYSLDPRDQDFATVREELLAERKPTDWISDKLTLEYQSDLNQRSEDMEEVEIEFFPQGGSTGGVLSFAREEMAAKVRVDPITGRISAAYNGEELDEEELDAAF
ncbi:MAG: prepilin-type N-terminal cleavage/methylation domain-containing protein [Pseudomonadota bacterium]